jgi:NAD(P)H-hydrate epimerase
MNTDLPKFDRQGEEPLYPKVLYSRPVTRAGGGSLLIVGGHSGEFVAPTSIYQLSVAAGAGECRVALPASLVKVVGDAPGIAYVAANQSGSLDIEALGRILELSETADALSVGASLSNSSQTAILLERLLAEIERPVVTYGDALAILQRQPRLLTDRADCLIIFNTTDALKLCTKLEVPVRFTGGGLINKLEIIRELAAATKCDYAVWDGDLITAAAGQLTVTKTPGLESLPAAYWAVLGVFWQQNATRRAEGLVTGAWLLGRVAARLAEAGAKPSVTAVAAAITKILAEHEEF